MADSATDSSELLSRLYRSLLERLGEAVVVWDARGTVVAMSPDARALHGLGSPEQAEMTAEEYRRRFFLRDPETRAPLPFEDWPLARALRGEAVNEARVLLCRRRDPVTHFVDASVGELSEPGLPPVFVGTLRHVAGRADGSPDSERILRTVIDALPIGVWFTDAQGQIVLGNAAGQRIWAGIRFVGPADYAQYRARWAKTGEPISSEEWALARALKGAESHGEVIEIETFEGCRKIVRNSALPFRDADGRIIGALALNEDITAEWNAQEQRERLLALIESSVDAIIAQTPEGTITDWNAGAERMYGYTRAEAVGAPISLIIPDDRVGEGAWLLELVGRGEALRGYETERLNKDGARLAISLSLSPIHNAAGRIVGVASIERDISRSKEIERRLEGQARALADADRRKDELLAVLAHELRNPLAPLANGIELIREQDGSRRFAGVLALLQRQVQFLSRLLDDLLDVSRIARGMLTIEKRALDLNEVVERAVEVARPLIEQRRHRLSVVRAPTPLRVRGDLQRLVQVLVNLLNNAAKYTHEGGAISVRCSGEGEQAVLRVRDTGSGIPPDMLERIFDLFHNPGELPHQPQRGLGLGLTLVRYIAEAHGGSVRARSPGTGAGSEFIVSLPRLADEPR